MQVYVIESWVDENEVSLSVKLHILAEIIIVQVELRYPSKDLGKWLFIVDAERVFGWDISLTDAGVEEFELFEQEVQISYVGSIFVSSQLKDAILDTVDLWQVLVHTLDLFDLNLRYLGGLGIFELESLIGVEFG